jgi:hypothetical protein
MRRVLAFALAVALAAASLVAPAGAQRITVPVATSATPQNVNVSYEAQGYNSNGTTTSLTAGTANAYATGHTAVGGALANDICGLWVDIGGVQSSTARYALRASTDDFSTTLFSNLYFAGSSSTSLTGRIPLPLKIAAGKTLKVDLQSSSASSTSALGVFGEVCNANSPPMYTVMEEVTTFGSSTRASGTDTVTDGSTWTRVTTSQAYGAFLISVGVSTANPADEAKTIVFASGANGSEVEIYRYRIFGSSTAGVQRGWSTVINHALPTSTQIDLKVLGATTTDNVRIQVFGFR